MQLKRRLTEQYCKRKLQTLHDIIPRHDTIVNCLGQIKESISTWFRSFNKVENCNSVINLNLQF